MKITSDSAGRYAPPAMHWSHHRGDLRHVQIAPHQRVVVEDPRRAVLSGKHAALIRQVDARRIDQIDDRDAARIAISCARRILVIVSGHHEPAFTVASLATTTTSRPATMPTPVITPAAGAWPSYGRTPRAGRFRAMAHRDRTSCATRSRAVSCPCRAASRSCRRLPPFAKPGSSSAREVGGELAQSRASRFTARAAARALRDPVLDVRDQVRRGRARSEELADAAVRAARPCLPSG